VSYDYDLDQPADVHWIPVDLMPPQEIGGGKEVHFATLREAVWFVMEDLPSRDRMSAHITSMDRSLDFDEIGGLFEQLKDD
jgi:hypothetical protein